MENTTRTNVCITQNADIFFFNDIECSCSEFKVVCCFVLCVLI